MLEEARREELERSVRERCERGQHEAALETLLRGYGAELYGFLVALHHDEAEAADAFSRLSEDLWKGLPGFSWECSLRTWSYVLARNASSRHRRRTAGQRLDVA